MQKFKAFFAIAIMMLTLRLLLRKDDAASLRMSIPLVLSIVTTMDFVSSKGVAPYSDKLRATLKAMRAKLAVLEGGDAQEVS